MKRTEAMTVGDIIDKLLREDNINHQFDEQKAVYLWPEVVGQGINRYTTSRWVKNGVLRGVLASPALLAVIPMADWLGLGSEARINVPGRADGNWQWRAADTALTTELAAEIRTMTARYFRARKPKAEPAAAAAKEPAAKPDKTQKVRTDAKKAERAVKK